ncbi:MAG: hypothetical protein ACYCPQ_05495 [Elusimicrobiota bacterium]
MTKNKNRSTAMLLISGFIALAILSAQTAANSQTLDWSRDPLSQIHAALKKAIKNNPYPRRTKSIPPSERKIPDGDILGVPEPGQDRFVASTPLDQHSVSLGFDYADAKNPKIKAVYSDCDDNSKMDACAEITFSFPELTVNLAPDLAHGTVLYKGKEVVALLMTDLGDESLYVVPTNGYRLTHENQKNGDATYTPVVFLEKPQADAGIKYYSGTMAFSGKTHHICFGISEQKMSRTEAPGGQAAYRVDPFQEQGQGLGIIDQCRTSLIDGSINACGGVTLSWTPGKLSGPVSILKEFNIGQYGLKKVGSYDVNSVDGCDPNFLFHASDGRD